MMVIGSLGDVVFNVSEREIKTIRDAKLSGSASIQSHQVHLSDPIVEYVGNNSKTYSFNIRISAALGSDPENDKNLLFEYMDTGRTVPFILGTKRIGSYRWLVEKLSVGYEHTDGEGKPITIDIAITLKEYPKGGSR